jgi:ERCC4-related helicase
MRLVVEIVPSFYYRRTRNRILQLLLHGNYVVAVLPTGFGKYIISISTAKFFCQQETS